MKLPRAVTNWRRWLIYLAIIVPVWFIDHALFAHHDFIWTWLGSCLVVAFIADELQRRYWRA